MPMPMPTFTPVVRSVDEEAATTVTVAVAGVVGDVDGGAVVDVVEEEVVVALALEVDEYLVIGSVEIWRLE